jgi:hypothetical protein
MGGSGGLQPGELAEPDPGQDSLHRRERHAQALGDLQTGHPQTAQRRDRLDPILRSRVGPPSTTRLASLNRCFGVSAALPWSLIRCPPWIWVALTPPASKEAPMNNVVRFYN